MTRMDVDAVAAKILKGARRGVALAAEVVLDESNRRVPHEEGTLEGSGTVTVDGVRATVSYDTPYAVRQHEDQDMRHDEGREAKYLEKALAATRNQVRDTIAASIRREMR